ncbi:MAG: hypothetical protein P4M01_07050 [Acidobacteriota bacterium]|nr:hypothetical protein [Acidobacteriota bacterium]
MRIQKAVALFFAVLLLGAMGMAQLPAAPRAEFDDAAAADVMSHLRDGLEAHSQHLFLGNFDREQMKDFDSFSDQIEAYFTRYESFRIVYHIVRTVEQDGKGYILAEATVESTPRGGGRASRREGQLRLTLAPVGKTWKIVDVNPRGFFF